MFDKCSKRQHDQLRLRTCPAAYLSVHMSMRMPMCVRVQVHVAGTHAHTVAHVYSPHHYYRQPTPLLQAAHTVAHVYAHLHTCFLTRIYPCKLKPTDSST